jgi:hypothetical protein
LAAQDIIATLMTKWCDSGQPSLTLAKTLIDAGSHGVHRNHCASQQLAYRKRRIDLEKPGRALLAKAPASEAA